MLLIFIFFNKSISLSLFAEKIGGNEKENME